MIQNIYSKKYSTLCANAQHDVITFEVDGMGYYIKNLGTDMRFPYNFRSYRFVTEITFYLRSEMSPNTTYIVFKTRDTSIFFFLLMTFTFKTVE